jgi:hypothetical protein
VDVPNAGRWLVEENPQFVTSELLRFSTDELESGPWP